MPTLQEITLAHSQRLSESTAPATSAWPGLAERARRAELSAIAAETKQAETEAFSRFRRDLESLKT